MKTDKIYLVGFMGAGKTSVARALGHRLGWRVEDNDDAIETRERRKIPEIFAKDGEPYFRALERDTLRALAPHRHVIVATGGGTFVDPDNRAAMRSDGATVWLDVPLAEAINRVPADGRRPLAADRAAFERLYHLRRAAYEQAHIRLDAGRASVDALVEQLVDWLEA